MVVGITGATGFIGEQLVRRHLAKKDEVRILSRRDCPLRYGEVHAEAADLARCSSADLIPFVNDLDILYHCAGELRDTSQMERVHVRGTSTLLEAAAGRVGRWIQLSSVSVYGRVRTGTVTEGTPSRPASTYGRTKATADSLVMARHAAHDIECVILRPSIVFGKTMSQRSLHRLITMVEQGWFFFIGPPGASANYIHVDNVIDALVLCATSDMAAGRVYNLSDWCTVESFVGVIADAHGTQPPRLRIPLWAAKAGARALGWVPRMPLTPSRVRALTNRARYSTDRVERELGYRHRVSIPEGLRDLIGTTGSRA